MGHLKLGSHLDTLWKEIGNSENTHTHTEREGGGELNHITFTLHTHTHTHIYIYIYIYIITYKAWTTHKCSLVENIPSLTQLSLQHLVAQQTSVTWYWCYKHYLIGQQHTSKILHWYHNDCYNQQE